MLPFDPRSPVETTTVVGPAVTIFDSLGARHVVELFFAKTSTGFWQCHGLTDGGGLTGGLPGAPTEILSVGITFDDQGRLVGAVSVLENFNPLGAENPQRLRLDFGSSDYGLTQYATVASLSWSADGAGGGALVRLTVGAHGTISGAFTNGETEPLGVVAVTTFAAPAMLGDRGRHLFSPTAASGAPDFVWRRPTNFAPTRACSCGSQITSGDPLAGVVRRPVIRRAADRHPPPLSPRNRLDLRSLATQRSGAADSRGRTNSGAPAPGSPCEGPRGCVVAGALEALSEATGPCIAIPIGTVAP